LVVASVEPVATLPLEPQELVPSEKEVETIPGPGEAVPDPLAGAGDEVLNPAGNVHCAMARPHTGLGVGAALFTVSVSLALFPVSRVPTNKWVVVFV
jgi:hypothetical protein